MNFDELVCSGWNSSTKWRRFLRFAKVLEENLMKMDNRNPEKTKRRTFTVV